MRTARCVVVTAFKNTEVERQAVLDVTSGIVDPELDLQDAEDEGVPVSEYIEINGKVEPVFYDEQRNMRVSEVFLNQLIAASKTPEAALHRQRFHP